MTWFVCIKTCCVFSGGAGVHGSQWHPGDKCGAGLWSELSAHGVSPETHHHRLHVSVWWCQGEDKPMEMAVITTVKCKKWVRKCLFVVVYRLNMLKGISHEPCHARERIQVSGKNLKSVRTNTWHFIIYLCFFFFPDNASHIFSSSNAGLIAGQEGMKNLHYVAKPPVPKEQKPAVDPVPQWIGPDYGESVTGEQELLHWLSVMESIQTLSLLCTYRGSWRPRAWSGRGGRRGRGGFNSQRGRAITATFQPWRRTSSSALIHRAGQECSECLTRRKCEFLMHV